MPSLAAKIVLSIHILGLKSKYFEQSFLQLSVSFPTTSTLNSLPSLLHFPSHLSSNFPYYSLSPHTHSMPYLYMIYISLSLSRLFSLISCFPPSLFEQDKSNAV